MAQSTATRPNPDRSALMRDIVAELDPQETELWRERWEHAREVAVDDIQAELIEGLRDFAQQYQDTISPYFHPEEQQAIQAWVMTAPATFRAGGPLERGERKLAAEEAQRNYAQMIAWLFRDDPALQRQLLAPDRRAQAQEFWKRVLHWTADRLDKGIEEATHDLWDFEPLQAALDPDVRALGPEALEDQLRADVLSAFPRTTAGDPVEALRQMR